MAPGADLVFDQETEPRVDFGKLEEGGVYPARIFDYEEGEWTNSGLPYVGWKIEINDFGDHWRHLPRTAYQTQTTGNVGNLRSLLHATGVKSVAQQREEGKAYINYDDLVGRPFQVKITYNSFDKVTVSEYPRVRSVFALPPRKGDEGETTDLPF